MGKNKFIIDLNKIKENAPFLRSGQEVYLSGRVLTARDAAHKRLIDLIELKKPLPVEINGAIIYYTGPTPAPPGQVIGSCGPTSSYRMDKYLGPLIRAGLSGVIGKGERSELANQLMRESGVIYFMAIAGAGALANKYIKSMKELAFRDLGPESIKELYLEGFPVIIN